MPCCLYRFPLGIAAAAAFAFLIAVSRAGCLFERRPFAPAVTRCGNDSGGFVCNLFFSFSIGKIFAARRAGPIFRVASLCAGGGDSGYMLHLMLVLGFFA